VGEQLAALVRFSGQPMSSAEGDGASIALERLTAHARASYVGENPLPGRSSVAARSWPEFTSQGRARSILVPGFRHCPSPCAHRGDTGGHRRVGPLRTTELVPAAVDEGLRCSCPFRTIRSVACDTA